MCANIFCLSIWLCCVGPAYIVVLLFVLNSVMLLIYGKSNLPIDFEGSCYCIMLCCVFFLLRFSFVLFGIVDGPCLVLDVNNCTFCIQYKCASQWQEKHNTNGCGGGGGSSGHYYEDYTSHDDESNICWLCKLFRLSKFSIVSFFYSSFIFVFICIAKHSSH